MHPPTRRQRVAAAALALVLAAEPTWASVGDRSPAYQRCTAVCRQQLCRDSPHSKPAPVPPDSQHPAPFAAYSTSLLWPCQATCSYACQQYLTDLALSHSPRPSLREAEPGGALEGLPVGQQVQFHGKWPFHRLDFSSLPLVPFLPLRVLGLFLPRLQEPLSVLFSLVNLYAHYLGLRSLRALRRAGRMQEGRRLARVYELYAWTGVNAWVWSVVFHTRDVDWTERADYFAAAGTMVAGLWVAVVRIQGWYASASKGKTLAPSQRRAALAWTAALVALFLVHCAYLGLSDRFDYTYNMRFNVLVALLTIGLWSLWSRAQSRLPTPSNFSRRQLSSYPSARSRFRAPHYLSPLPPLLLLPALTALELLDFAPLGPFGLRLLDAHALWHASTVPVVSLWYTFLVRDVRWIDGQGEGGDPSSVLPRVPASGGRTGTGGGEGEGEGGAKWVLEKVLREGRRMTGLGTGAGLGIFGGFGEERRGGSREGGGPAGGHEGKGEGAEAARDGRRD